MFTWLVRCKSPVVVFGATIVEGRSSFNNTTYDKRLSFFFFISLSNEKTKAVPEIRPPHELKALASKYGPSIRLAEPTCQTRPAKSPSTPNIASYFSYSYMRNHYSKKMYLTPKLFQLPATESGIIHSRSEMLQILKFKHFDSNHIHGFRIV